MNRVEVETCNKEQLIKGFSLLNNGMWIDYCYNEKLNAYLEMDNKNE